MTVGRQVQALLAGAGHDHLVAAGGEADGQRPAAGRRRRRTPAPWSPALGPCPPMASSGRGSAHRSGVVGHGIRRQRARQPSAGVRPGPGRPTRVGTPAELRRTCRASDSGDPHHHGAATAGRVLRRRAPRRPPPRTLGPRPAPGPHRPGSRSRRDVGSGGTRGPGPARRIPGPRSMIRMSTRPATGPASMRSPLPPAWMRALSTRLATARSSRTGSVRIRGTGLGTSTATVSPRRPRLADGRLDQLVHIGAPVQDLHGAGLRGGSCPAGSPPGC